MVGAMTLMGDLGAVPVLDEDFAAACAEHRARLYHLARDVLRDDGEAQDAVLDTLEIAWRSRSSLRDPEALGPWLTRICLRRALRLRLRAWHRRAAETTRFTVPSLGGDADVATLDHAVGRLSPRQRAVIVLHYRDGYSLDECAELLRCRSGTVRQHLSRALASLREELSR